MGSDAVAETEVEAEADPAVEQPTRPFDAQELADLAAGGLRPGAEFELGLEAEVEDEPAGFGLDEGDAVADGLAGGDAFHDEAGTVEHTDSEIDQDDQQEEQATIAIALPSEHVRERQDDGQSADGDDDEDTPALVFPPPEAASHRPSEDRRPTRAPFDFESEQRDTLPQGDENHADAPRPGPLGLTDPPGDQITARPALDPDRLL
jgi:hypothetical protein